MSSGAVRLGDFVAYTCPDDPKRPGPFIEGSNNTFVNGRPLCRLGDKAIPGPAITGSNKRFTNGRPTVRLKDRVVCGRITQASNNTFIG